MASLSDSISDSFTPAFSSLWSISNSVDVMACCIPCINEKISRFLSSWTSSWDITPSSSAPIIFIITKTNWAGRHYNAHAFISPDGDARLTGGQRTSDHDVA